jgi:hypothetical protein
MGKNVLSHKETEDFASLGKLQSGKVGTTRERGMAK